MEVGKFFEIGLDRAGQVIGILILKGFQSWIGRLRTESQQSGRMEVLARVAESAVSLLKEFAYLFRRHCGSSLKKDLLEKAALKMRSTSVPHPPDESIERP